MPYITKSYKENIDLTSSRLQPSAFVLVTKGRGYQYTAVKRNAPRLVNRSGRIKIMFLVDM